MAIGKDIGLDHNFDSGKGNSEAKNEATAAQGRWQDELYANQKAPGAKTDSVQVAANDYQIGPNGLPVTNDPMTNKIFERMSGHMHGPQSPANAGIDNLGHRTVANSGDMEAGLYGPKSPQNAAQYNSILQDFHTIDANFSKELTAHGISGPQADILRKSLYFSNNENQRQQLLKAYNLSVPQGFNAFEQKYGQKASLAMHWAMEQH